MDPKTLEKTIELCKRVLATSDIVDEMASSHYCPLCNQDCVICRDNIMEQIEHDPDCAYVLAKNLLGTLI